MIGAILATFLFATSSVTAKQSVQRLGSSTANLYRLLLATTLLGICAHGWGVGFRGPSLPWFLLSGIIGYGVCDTALFLALPRLGARLTSLMVQCLAAPFAAITEWLWLDTHLGPRQIGSSLMILVGVAVALIPDRTSSIPAPLSPSHSHRRLALGLAVLAAFGQALGAVISRHGQSISAKAGFPIDPFSVSYQRIVAGAIFGAIWWSIQSWWSSATPVLPTPRHHRVPTVMWVVLNGVSGPFLGVACYQWALKHQPTGVVLSITSLTPLAVIPLARRIDGEWASRRSLFGGCLAVAGVLALTMKR